MGGDRDTCDWSRGPPDLHTGSEVQNKQKVLIQLPSDPDLLQGSGLAVLQALWSWSRF